MHFILEERTKQEEKKQGHRNKKQRAQMEESVQRVIVRNA
jgi:hypothetical protein